jgi:UDP-N-acetylmuramyl pentapeptide phosphotransferase/UDP-N-acetylglucosamine-1-phosphate transferase
VTGALLIATLVVMGAWSINAANFLDGRNGLLSGLMIVLLFAVPLLDLIDNPLNLALAGLWLGFLPFNFPRARVFMGDVGSYFAGGTLAYLMLLAAQKSITHLLAFWVFSAPILVDPSLTLLHRAVRKKRLSEAHREHLYQYLSRIGVKDVKLLCLFALYAVISTGLAHYMIDLPAPTAFGVMLAFVAISAWLWRVARIHAVQSFRRQQRNKAA